VRVSLGATPGRIARMVAGDGARPAVVGVVVGLVVAVWLRQAMASLLFGVEGLDVWAFGGAAVVLGVVAAASCVLPAARAAQIDPARALRAE